MKNRQFPVLIPLILLAVCLACNLSTPDSPMAELAVSQEGGVVYQGAVFSDAPAYRTHLELRFEGNSPWIYQLETRRAEQLVEYNLHVEGVDPSRYPGDVRLVSDGEITRMSGAGTENQCLQYPADMDLSVSFLTLEQVFPRQVLASALVAVGEDALFGMPTLQYRVVQENLGKWRDVSLDIWLEKQSGTPLKYILQATGDDPLFKSGEGRLSARYEVVEIASQTIEPVGGCEIQFPIPQDAQRLVRLPEMIAFESSASVQVIVAYYQATLSQAGWTEAEIGFSEQGTAVMSYYQSTAEVEIHVEPKGNGVRVTIYF